MDMLLDTKDVDKLNASIAAGASLTDALPRHIGGCIADGGLWRFFSPEHPACGISRWNQEWCSAWGLSRDAVLSFGEDVFGNQLLIVSGRPTAFLCGHEDGSCHDLELGLIDLLQAVVQHGLSWIDFYGNGALPVGRTLLPRLSWEQHIHWTQPLILGGAANAQNASIVERHAHLRGHAALWKQVSHLSPATEVHFD